MNTKIRSIRWVAFLATVAAVQFVGLPLSLAQYGDDEDSYEAPLPDGVLGKSGFAVEDFVPNRIKIDATADERRFSRNEPFRVRISGEEMFGQPITGSAVSAFVTWKPEAFAPDAWKDYKFGDAERKFDLRETPIEEQVLGDDGKTSISIEPPRQIPPAALAARVQVTVTEGGRGVTRSLKRIVDPVDYYLGVKLADQTFPEPGKETRVEVAAVSPNGDLAAVDAVLTGTISMVKWNSNLVREGGAYVFKTNRELLNVAATSVTLAGGRGALSWEPKTVGNYLVQLTDTASSASVSDNFYVSDNQWSYQPWSMEEPEAAELVLDKKTYRVGETARLLVKAPFPGTVLLTLEQDRVLTSSLHNLTGNTLEIPVTVTEDMLPNVYAVAEVIRPVKPEAQWLPHRAVGNVNLPVSAESRVLDIALHTPAEVRPGDKLTVTADLRDAATSVPVAGDVIIWAVDEGVLTLTDFKTPSPGDFFFSARRLMVSTSDLFSALMPDLIEGAKAASATGGGDGEEARLSPVASERIKPVILWQGAAKTSADGKAQVEWIVPQYMGRLRVMALAAEGRRFGNGEKTVFVRNPIMVKEHLPRFAAPGDKFTGGFTVYNNTDAEVSATLALSADKPVTIAGPEAEVIPSVAARGQLNSTREFSVDENATGHAVLKIKASAGADSFATSISLPVRPASPRVTEMGSITVDAGKDESFRLPGSDHLAGTTSLTLLVGGRPDLQLAGALNYNLQYPYGCTEQVISSLFPLLYLKDLARNMNPDQYSDSGIRDIIQSGIDRIFMSQVASGGLSMWIGGHTEWDWTSIYAAHFLVEARRNNYDVPEQYLDSLLAYIQAGLNSSATATNDDLTQRAYTCYVLARAERKVQQRMERLYDAREKLSVEARAMLAAAYHECGLPDEARVILQSATLSGASATTGTRQTGGILSSPARETALLLLTWADLDANSNEAIELANRLDGLQKVGHWGTTQDNVFALLALGKYLQKTASDEPAKGTVSYGGKSVPFTSGSPAQISSAEMAGADVTINCEDGTAHASWVVQGIPVNPAQGAVANGVTIERAYLDRNGEPLDMDAIHQGDIVLVELTIGGNRSIDNVVIQDLLPAGLEIENSRLASSEAVEEAEEEADSGLVVNRTDIRDDRMIVFGDLYRKKDSQQTYRYTTRAVTPGDYVVPQAQLEVMYDPQVSARSKAGRLVIKPR